MYNEKIDWSLTLEVRSKSQYTHIVEKLARSNIFSGYTVNIKNNDGQFIYEIKIHKTPWIDNLLDVANIASEVDPFSEEKHLEPWSSAWLQKHQEEIRKYYERGINEAASKITDKNTNSSWLKNDDQLSAIS